MFAVPPSATPTRILVLDANPGFVAAASRFVEHLPGCVRVTADVALVDLGLAGLALAQRLKAGDPALGVIALALFPTAELVDEAQRIGIDAVVAKESFADELPRVLERLRGGQ